MQCTLVFVEYPVRYLSVHQISTYSRVKPVSLYAEHILSSLLLNLKSLAEYPVQPQNWRSLELQCLHFDEKTEYWNKLCDFI